MLARNKFTRPGFNLIELMMVVVLAGILAALALPSVMKTLEKTKTEEALVSLAQIKTAQLLYRQEEDNFWPQGTAESDVAKINSQLNLTLDVLELSWDYSVSATSDGASFEAKASRQRGRYAGKEITLDQNGNWGGNWPLYFSKD